MKQIITFFLLTTGTLLHAQATWQAKDTVPAAGRFWAAATGNSTHGYAGCGRLQFSGLNNTVSDMYAYELASDTWTSIPDYPGGVREGLDAFTINERIFFAFGTPFIQFTRTIHEYIPASNSWVQHPDVPGIGFAYSHGFVIGDTYYIGPENGTNQVYAFDANTNSWSTVAPFPGNDRRAQCAFSANGKGYLGMGAGVFSGVYGDWWEYDPLTDSWVSVADIFPNSDQSSATAVAGVGYVFNVGGSGGGGKQLYQYDMPNDIWIADAVLPTDRIANCSLFTIADKGFLVFGESTTSGGNVPSNQLWQFTPGTTSVGEREENVFGLTVAATGAHAVHISLRRPLTAQGELILLDATGKVLDRHRVVTGSQPSIELGNELPGGVYIVHLLTEANSFAVRVAVSE